MDARLLIKYEWEDVDAGFNMATLGESLVGFHAVLNELFAISNIQGELQVRTVKVKEGSVEIISILDVVLNGHYPFTSIPALYDFLETTNEDLLKVAQDFFSAIGNTGKTINDFFNENQFMGSLAADFISGYMIYLIGKQQSRKEKDADKNIPKRYANKLKQLQQRNTYKRALKPLVDGEFKSIKVAQLAVDSPKEIVIEEKNLPDYLSDDSQILPDFVNGQEVKITARVVGLQSTKGETVKLKVDNIDPNNNLLMAHPPEGTGTENFRELYGENVLVVAEVYRRTLYKRPELLIRSMEKSQMELGLDSLEE